jgi:formyltetrahydrofolate hydrolase
VETDYRVRSAGRRMLDSGHRPGACRPEIGRLPTTCPGQPGIVAAVSGFLFANGANISESQQHSTDPPGGIFFLRIRSHLAALVECFDDLAAGSGELDGRFPMRRQLTMADRHPADRLIAHPNKTIVFT